MDYKYHEPILDLAGFWDYYDLLHQNHTLVLKQALDEPQRIGTAWMSAGNLEIRATTFRKVDENKKVTRSMMGVPLKAENAT